MQASSKKRPSSRDPRKPNFFNTPSKPATNNDSATLSRPRRKSTARSPSLFFSEDGFVYTKKRKTELSSSSSAQPSSSEFQSQVVKRKANPNKKSNTKDTSGKIGPVHSTKVHSKAKESGDVTTSLVSSPSDPQTFSATSEVTREIISLPAKRDSEQEQKNVNTSKSKLEATSPPIYPPVSMESLTELPSSVFASSAPEVNLQRLIEYSCQCEMDIACKTFKDDHSYVTEVIRRINDRFLKEVQEKYVVDSVRNLRHEPVQKYQNEQNLQYQADEDMWMAILQQTQAEIKEWENSLAKVKKIAEAAHFEICDSADSKFPSVVPQPDQEYLTNNCANLLSRVIPSTYQSISLQSDVMLSHLRQMNRCVNAGHEFQSHVAALLNESSILDFQNVSPSRLPSARGEDARALISNMLEGATIVNKAAGVGEMQVDNEAAIAVDPSSPLAPPVPMRAF